MKKTCTLLLFILSISFSVGQTPYFNEWFAADPDRPFIKLLVSEDAVYEVTAADLLAAGHDLSQAQPDSIQLFYRGEEIPLTVERDAQGQLMSLTFYGRRNDGAVEAQMYRNPVTGAPEPGQQPNPNFSIYSDTSAYFLTWGSALGKRYSTAMDTNYSNYTPEASYPYEHVWEPHPDSTSASEQKAVPVVGGGGAYDSFYKLNSNFGPGEGYVSEQQFASNAPFVTSFLKSPLAISGPQDVRFQFRIFHESNSQHHVKVTPANRPLDVILDTVLTFNQVAMRTYTRSFNTVLSPQSDLVFQALAPGTDENRLTSIRLRYARIPDLGGATHTRISEWPRNTITYFRFANARGQNKVWAYDPANDMRYEGLISGGVAHVVLSGRFYGKKVEVVTDQGFKKPLIAAKTGFRNLCHPDSGVQFVVLAHRKLDTSALAYATYRDTTLAGYEPLSAKVVYIDEIYEEFSYGSPTPQAIHQFVNCALENWTVKPKYIFLWGKGKVWLRNDPDAMIPSYGYPANDVFFTTPWNGTLSTQVAIGRLNIYNNTEGRAYLDKVKEFEQTGAADWRKKGVFWGYEGSLGGQNTINLSLSNYIDCFEDSLHIGGNAISTLDSLAVTNIHARIDSGAALITYFGSAGMLGLPIFEAFEYTNYSKYPLFVGMGEVGGDWSGRESYGERWVKEAGRGAIAFLSNSSFGYISPLKDYGNIFFCQQLSPFASQPLGEIVRRTFQRMVDSLPGIQYLNHARQMNLQGDPALVIFPSSVSAGINPLPLVSVRIYPNPVGDELTISSVSDPIERVILFNLHGQMVLKQENVFKSKVQLDVSSLKPGYYFIQYKTQQGSGVTKLVVE